MKFNSIAIVIACALVGSFGYLDRQYADAGISSTFGGVGLTEFTVMQHQNVETVTCANYFAHYDLQQYGSIEGDTCTETAPLLIQNGNVGNITVKFTLTNGAKINLAGCRVDSTILTPGYYKASINCINF